MLIQNEIYIYSDGGARGNPGPAACAFAVYDQKKKLISQGSKFLGVKTNNVAEYLGVISALSWLLEQRKNFQAKNIIFYLDSELVCRQLNGHYKIKNKNLIALSKKIFRTINYLGVKVRFVSIPRSSNVYADKLVNKILDKYS